MLRSCREPAEPLRRRTFFTKPAAIAEEIWHLAHQDRSALKRGEAERKVANADVVVTSDVPRGSRPDASVLLEDGTRTNAEVNAMSTRFDAIVIGTIQSGPSLAVRLAAAGRKVAIVERKRFGGTCVNTG
jgi:hypothetical protein